MYKFSILFFTLSVLCLTLKAQSIDINAKLSNLFSTGKKTIPEKNIVKQIRKTSQDAFFVNEVSSIIFNSVIKGSTPAKTYGRRNIDPQYCPFVTPNCSSNSSYRTIDGTCNNLNYPLYGSANTPFKRFLPPTYDDGFNSPRTKALSGKNLPHPRIISLVISPTEPDDEDLDHEISQLYSIFGQFITHDFMLTSAITDQNNIELDCPCGSTSPDCFSLDWPLNDPFINHSCMKVTRSSASTADMTCSLDYREQLNLFSAFPDGTQIYGHNAERINTLRTFSGGLLNTSEPVHPYTNERVSAQKFLPLADASCSSSSSQTYKCFLAGESRTSENLALVSMHTLFQREHNRVARQLAQLNPNWNDETLYQEAKKIVLAIYQHIIYNEWVPMINGDNSLKPIMDRKAYYSGYNRLLNPSLYNEFATAAFRFGHSLIRDIFQRYDIKGNELGPIKFFDMNFKSDYAYDAKGEGIDGLFRGVVKEYGWEWGTFGFDMQNRLEGKFENNVFTAIDLLARNIIRGRDHGLQPYIKYVKYCHNITITTFDDLCPLMSKISIQQLKLVYENVGDIDLYAGGLSEEKFSDFYSTGHTFGCLIMKQFTELKNGDRFYYENGPNVNPSAFTLDQLAEIKKVTMAGLICNNYEFELIQPNAFFVPRRKNDEVDCTTFRNQVNLTFWKR